MKRTQDMAQKAAHQVLQTEEQLQQTQANAQQAQDNLLVLSQDHQVLTEQHQCVKRELLQMQQQAHSEKAYLQQTHEQLRGLLREEHQQILEAHIDVLQSLRGEHRELTDALQQVQAQCTVTHCNALQHSATLCNTLQHSAAHCSRELSGIYVQARAANTRLQHTIDKKGQLRKEFEVLESRLGTETIAGEHNNKNGLPRSLARFLTLTLWWI